VINSKNNEVDADDMAPVAPEPGQKNIEDGQREAAEEREEEGGYQ
jgi:hypothetical protein